MRERTREQRVSDVQRAAAEVTTFEELGRDLVPGVRRLVDASSDHLYRSEPACPMATVSGDALAALAPAYIHEHLPTDPLQRAIGRDNPWVFVFSRSPEWRPYLRSSAHEFWVRRGGVHYLLHLRLGEGAHYQPGLTGLALGRLTRQGDFTDDDAVTAAQVLPSLLAATRRCERALAWARARAVLEGMLEDGALHPRLALDLRGGLRWMSARAARRLGGGRPPRALEEAARSFASPEPRLAVALRDAGGAALRAELHLARDAGGEAFVVVELETPGLDPVLIALGERHGLTRAEIEVLKLLAGGLRDEEVARRTHTSRHTVRTHVGHVLGKLGVRSRLEAALLARGATLMTDR